MSKTRRSVAWIVVVVSLAYEGIALAGFGFATGPTASAASDSVAIAWENEAVGDGVVFYGTSPGSLSLSATDRTTDVITHVVPIAGLAPSTEYFFQVRSTNSNGDVVAESDILSFVTQAAAPAIIGTLSTPDAEPRRIHAWGTTRLSARLHLGGANIAGAAVTFEVVSGAADLGPVGGGGGGTSATVYTDADGIATVLATAGSGEVVKVDVYSPSARNRLQIPFATDR